MDHVGKVMSHVRTFMHHARQIMAKYKKVLTHTRTDMAMQGSHDSYEDDHEHARKVMEMEA